MRWLAAFCVSIVCILSAGAVAAQETRIAAVVNDQIVTQGDLAARLKLVLRSSGIPDTPENRQRLSSRVLRTLIDEKLQLEEAKRLEITVEQSDIDAALARLEQRNNMPKGGLDAFLKQNDIPRSTLVDQVTAALAWDRILRERVTQDVEVSDEEVNDAMARLKAEIGKPQSRVEEIFLAVDNPSQEDEVRQLAQRLIQQISNGANFAAVAQQFSQSPTAAVGGDLGWVTPGQLSPLLGEAVGKMNPGEMSYPIRTPAGFYILYVVDRKTLGAANPDETLLSLVEVVFPLAPSASAEERDHVAAEAQDAAAGAKDCGQLSKIGIARAPQLSRQIPQIAARDLPPAIRSQMLALKVNEASKPMPLQGGMGVVMVCQRQDPPGIPTRDQVTDNLAHERLDALARRYMRDLRRSAYVDIRG